MAIHLAVFFGGKSVEHEVSIISALQAMEALDRTNYTIIPLYITKDNELYYGEHLQDIEEYRDIPALLKKSTQVYLRTTGSKTYVEPCARGVFSGNKPLALVDVALPIVHGTNVEDGALQGYLTTLNLPYAGCDVLASAVCMDKYVSKLLLKEAGFPVLDCLRFTLADYKTPQEIISRVESRFAYPVIVKPINTGSSIGVTVASDADGLDAALDTAFSFAEKIIVEPAIQQLQEINCSVVGDCEEAVASECEEPLGSDEILSYTDKYVGGSKGEAGKGMASLKRRIPADIPQATKDRIQEIATGAFQFLGCSGVARIDFLIDRGTKEVWLNELNTIPGSLSFYLWEPVGLSYAKLLDRLVELALKRQRREAGILHSFETNILSAAGLPGSKSLKGGKR